jgi:hypothetical protein
LANICMARGLDQLLCIERADGYKADPGGVFLLRFEPVPLVAQFVPDAALPPGGNLVRSSIA